MILIIDPQEKWFYTNYKWYILRQLKPPVVELHKWKSPIPLVAASWVCKIKPDLFCWMDEQHQVLECVCVSECVGGTQSTHFLCDPIMTFETKLTMALAGCSGSCSANRWHMFSVSLWDFLATNPKILEDKDRDKRERLNKSREAFWLNYKCHMATVSGLLKVMRNLPLSKAL